MTDSKAYLPFILFVFLQLCSHVFTRELSEGVKYSHKDEGNNLMTHPITLLHDMERGLRHDLVDIEDSTRGETDYYQKERFMVYPMQIKPVEPVQPIPQPQPPNPEPEQDLTPHRHNNIHTTNYLIGYYQPFITSPMSSTKRDHRTPRVPWPFSLEDIVESITEANWQSLVVESDTLVLVEFWTPRCASCCNIRPIIHEIAMKYAGKLKCYKLNTIESPSTTTQYRIRSIPTVIIFKNGKKRDAMIGVVSKRTLMARIEKFLYEERRL